MGGFFLHLKTALCSMSQYPTKSANKPCSNARPGRAMDRVPMPGHGRALEQPGRRPDHRFWKLKFDHFAFMLISLNEKYIHYFYFCQCIPIFNSFLLMYCLLKSDKRWLCNWQLKNGGRALGTLLYLSTQLLGSKPFRKSLLTVKCL